MPSRRLAAPLKGPLGHYARPKDGMSPSGLAPTPSRRFSSGALIRVARAHDEIFIDVTLDVRNPAFVR